VVRSGEVSQVGFDDTGSEALATGQWAGYRNRYWALMAHPPGEMDVVLQTAAGRQDAEVRFEAAAGAWSFYLGPVEPRALAAAAPELGQLMYAALWFWLRWTTW